MRRIAIVAAITAIAMAGGTAAYSAGSINGDNIKSNTIDGSKIENNSVASADIKDSSLTGTDLKDGSISGADVADASLTGADIKDGTLGTNDLATGAVDSIDIKDGSITAGDIRPDTLAYIEDQANLRRGGKTGIVAYASNTDGVLKFVDGNGAVYSGGEGGDFLAVMTASFTTTVPVKVSMSSQSGSTFAFCIADPAGFGVASCTITAPITPGYPPMITATTADGSGAGALHPVVTTALVKVG